MSTTTNSNRDLERRLERLERERHPDQTGRPSEYTTCATAMVREMATAWGYSAEWVAERVALLLHHPADFRERLAHDFALRARREHDR